jgi:hypothetical protein
MGMGSQGSVLWRIRIAATMAVTLRDSPATTVKVTQVSVIFRKVFFEAIEFSGLSDIKIESNGYFGQRIFIVTVFWRGRNGDRDTEIQINSIENRQSHKLTAVFFCGIHGI